MAGGVKIHGVALQQTGKKLWNLRPKKKVRVLQFDDTRLISAGGKYVDVFNFNTED